MPTATPQSQDYVQTCLERIEKEFGIKQAKVLRLALRKKRMLDRVGRGETGICTMYLPDEGV